MSSKFYDIASYNSWVHIEQINKGWSKDKKYYIEDKDGKNFLLRVSELHTYEHKKKEFEMMKEIYQLDILMSKPIDFGICDNGEHVYSILSWIEGTDAEEGIASFSDEEQYQMGIEAGKILRKVHSIAAPKEQQNWEKRMTNKIKYHLERYQSCGVKVPGDEFSIRYIQEHLHLLKERPQVYQHGDFHIGNLIITPSHSLGVIDFNRWDYGDPYEEFYKMMMFSREVSIPFVLGQLKGYFGDNIPQDFFDILALYVADTILFSVAWAIPFGDDDVQGMVRRAEVILEDYSNFTTTIPKWYKEG